MKKLLARVGALSLLLLMGSFSPVYAENYEKSPQVIEFIDDLTLNHGFAKEQLVELFRQVNKQQPILDLISKPAEKAKLWKEYRPIFLTTDRVKKGIEFWQENEQALTKAEKTYGVPAQVIVAIIGVETYYGRNTGSWSVIDALTTLGFDYPPRSAFFKKELKEYLLLTREQQIDPLKQKGSYAGAMGISQFMPSSFRAYAVDFDDDGHINIWSNPTDAIGSVANYFKRHGWKADGLVAFQVKAQGKKKDQGLSNGLNLDKKVGQLKKLGWSLPSNLSDNAKVIAFRLDGSDGDEYWVGLPNFEVITRYNRSVMYSLVVFQLSEELLAAKNTK